MTSCHTCRFLFLFSIRRNALRTYGMLTRTDPRHARQFSDLTFGQIPGLQHSTPEILATTLAAHYNGLHNQQQKAAYKLNKKKSSTQTAVHVHHTCTVQQTCSLIISMQLISKTLIFSSHYRLLVALTRLTTGAVLMF